MSEAPSGPPWVAYCPRCDRQYLSQVSFEDVMRIVKHHVSEQHPDHDPEWADE